MFKPRKSRYQLLPLEVFINIIVNTTKKTANDYAINLIKSNEKDNSSLAHTCRQSNPHHIKSSSSKSYSKLGFHGININLCFNRKALSRKIRN